MEPGVFRSGEFPLTPRRDSLAVRRLHEVKLGARTPI
jgi:hypothetical protein